MWGQFLRNCSHLSQTDCEAGFVSIRQVLERSVSRGFWKYTRSWRDDGSLTVPPLWNKLPLALQQIAVWLSACLTLWIFTDAYRFCFGLWISWFRQLFCGRSRNLEFMITIMTAILVKVWFFKAGKTVACFCDTGRWSPVRNLHVHV